MEGGIVNTRTWREIQTIEYSKKIPWGFPDVSQYLTQILIACILFLTKAHSNMFPKF